MSSKAEVVKVDEKTFKVMLGSHEIGTSKTDFDARFHVNAINEAFTKTQIETLEILKIALDSVGMASLNNGGSTVRQFIDRVVQNLSSIDHSNQS